MSPPLFVTILQMINMLQNSKIICFLIHEKLTKSSVKGKGRRGTDYYLRAQVLRKAQKISRPLPRVSGEGPIFHGGLLWHSTPDNGKRCNWNHNLCFQIPSARTLSFSP